MMTVGSKAETYRGSPARLGLDAMDIEAHRCGDEALRDDTLGLAGPALFAAAAIASFVAILGDVPQISPDAISGAGIFLLKLLSGLSGAMPAIRNQ